MYFASHEKKQASIHEAFLELSNSCPSSILEKGKRRRNSNNLLRHDPAPIDFVNLDSIIKIDKDDEGIKLFFNKVCHCVETVAKCVERFCQDWSCTVHPAGSFPLNLKIENIDEFDFVLILESKRESFKINHGLFYLPFEKKVFVDIIEDVFRKSNYDELSNFKINLFRKRYAVNIRFSWTCPTRHKHLVDLDLVLDLKTSTSVQEYFESLNFPLKDTPFEGSINMNDNVSWTLQANSDHDGRVDTNLFDKQMFETYSSIFPNTKLCYRIAKFIFCHISPFEIRDHYCELTKEKVYHTKPIYSSYILKRLLLREIKKCSSSDDWKIPVIPIRLASILEHFFKESILGDFFDGKPVEPFRKVLTRLIEWLCNGCPKIILEPKQFNSNCSRIVSIIVAQRGFTGEFRSASGSNFIMKARQSVLSTLHDSCFGSSYLFLRFGIFDSQLIETNIFRGIYQSFDGALNDMKNIDLSHWNVNEAEKMILLLTCGVITEEDIESNYYIEKLYDFNKLLQSYDKTHFDVFHPGLWLLYYICFSEDFTNELNRMKNYLLGKLKLRIEEKPDLYQLLSKVVWLSRNDGREPSDNP